MTLTKFRTEQAWGSYQRKERFSEEVVMVSSPIQVLVVDDHAMVRKGMHALLNEFEDIRVIGEAADGLKAIELVDQLKPDVVLIDLLMPLMDGAETIKRIIAIQPGQRIIVLTAFGGDDKLISAIRAGAMGYLLKDIRPEDLVQSIRKVYAGEPLLNPTIAWNYMRSLAGVETPQHSGEQLTERELEVLRLLTQGKSDQEIAQQLVVADVTIRTHISRILTKLSLENRVQAALYAIQAGIVTLDEAYDGS
jgi:two-component system, NarL family, response regulator LiaR